VAVVQMGDPSHVPGQTQGERAPIFPVMIHSRAHNFNFFIDVGTSTNKGTFPRLDTAACGSNFASITQSYCDSGDEFCDSGLSLLVHLSYVTTYGAAAAKFIQSKV
jgi:acetylxylan esterase